MHAPGTERGTAVHPVSTYRGETPRPIASSDQALLRPPRRVAYGCFLPDLTGFTTPRGTGPNLQGCLWERPSTRWGPQHEEFRPAIADCGLQGTATSPPSTTFLALRLLPACEGQCCAGERRGWDSNPRGAFGTHALSRRADSTALAPLLFTGDKKAEREGFEPPVPVGTVDFESTAFNRSAISPWLLVPRVHTVATRWANRRTAAHAVDDAGSERTR